MVLLLLAVRTVSSGRDDIEVYNKRIPFSRVYKALTILLPAILWVVLVILALTVNERADFLTLLFETVPAFGTVGLTVNHTARLSEPAGC